MKKKNTLVNAGIIILSLVAVFYILYIGASIIIPFVVALLISFVILSLVSFFQKRGIPRFISFILSLGVIIGIIFTIGQIINTNINEISAGASAYEEKLTRIALRLVQPYNSNPQNILDQFVSNVNIPTLVSSVLSITTSFVKNAGIILFFTIFILLESASFTKKLELVTWGSDSTFFTVFEQIRSDIRLFFWVKTFVSFLWALISFTIMYIFEIDFIYFWTFLIFLLNYVPNFWSIIAVFFPVLFSLIQYESVPYSLILLLLLMLAQWLSGSLIETRLMGNRLNLSGLVILISLIFWGTLWGPIGMLLSIPIMVTINIILAHIEATRPLAILLSENGNIRFNLPKQSIGKGRFILKRMHSSFFKKTK